MSNTDPDGVRGTSAPTPKMPRMPAYVCRDECQDSKAGREHCAGLCNVAHRTFATQPLPNDPNVTRACEEEIAARGVQPSVAPLPKWEPCNEGCDPEFNGCRSRSCKCPAALVALGVRVDALSQRLHEAADRIDPPQIAVLPETRAEAAKLMREAADALAMDSYIVAQRGPNPGAGDLRWPPFPLPQ